MYKYLFPFFLLFLEIELADISEPRVSPTIGTVILLTVTPICGFLSWFVWKSSKLKYRSSDSLKGKLVEFRRVEVKRYLILEAVCALSLIGLWLTAHYLLVIIYFAVLAQFSFLRPSEDRLIRNMELTKKERDLLHAESI